MKADVVYEKRLRLAEVRKHPRHFLGHRRKAIGEAALRRHAGRADFQNSASFKDLLAGEAMQGRQKTERTCAEPWRAGGDERASALSRFDHSHRCQRMQS